MLSNHRHGSRLDPASGLEANDVDARRKRHRVERRLVIARRQRPVLEDRDLTPERVIYHHPRRSGLEDGERDACLSAQWVGCDLEVETGAGAAFRSDRALRAADDEPRWVVERLLKRQHRWLPSASVHEEERRLVRDGEQHGPVIWRERGPLGIRDGPVVERQLRGAQRAYLAGGEVGDVRLGGARAIKDVECDHVGVGARVRRVAHVDASGLGWQHVVDAACVEVDFVQRPVGREASKGAG